MGCAGVVYLLVFLAIGGTVAAVLINEANKGSETIERYRHDIRQGASVTRAVAGDEATTIRNLLFSSEDISTSNFYGQNNTACFFVVVHSPAGDRDLNVLLHEYGGTQRVVRMSLKRTCECPIDEEEPCRL